MTTAYDFLVIGGGIVGLTTARALRAREAKARIAIVDKECTLGLHASGRNSGVLHTGIYYPPDTLKATYCRDGAEAMRAYAGANGISVRRDGKLIVATSATEVERLAALEANATSAGISCARLEGDDIKRIEPHANASFGALYCEATAVIDARGVLARLQEELQSSGVDFMLGEPLVRLDERDAVATIGRNRVGFGVLVNAAGAYADMVAKLAGYGTTYEMLPFKGAYKALKHDQSHRVRASIYPVPDPALPFLGIHFTRSIDSMVYVGPTAMPAFGRENYHAFAGVDAADTLRIGRRLVQLMLTNRQGMRSLVARELPHMTRRGFERSARRLLDRLDSDWLKSTPKSGIRPQLFNRATGRLEMDFVIEEGPRTLHVLNSISPAFTSSLAVAEHIADRVTARHHRMG